MRVTSAIAFSIGLAILPAAVTQAQLGGLGEAAKQGATDAMKKAVVEGIVGTPSPTASATPSASPAPTTSPSATPHATATSPAMEASPAATASPTTAQDAGRMLMEEAGKKLAPKVP